MVGYQFWTITITELVVLIFKWCFYLTFFCLNLFGDPVISWGLDLWFWRPIPPGDEPSWIADRPNWLSLGPWLGGEHGGIHIRQSWSPVRGSPVCSVCWWLQASWVQTPSGWNKGDNRCRRACHPGQSRSHEAPRCHNAAGCDGRTACRAMDAPP